MKIVFILIVLCLLNMIILINNKEPIELNFKIISNSDNFLNKSPVNNDNLIKIYEEKLNITSTLNDKTSVNICIGTPPQCFNLLIDTGSQFLWVADKYSNFSNIPNKFDYKNSSSFYNSHLPYILAYVNGFAVGNISLDVVRIGKLSTMINFLLVSKEEVSSGFDGVLGLGYTYDNSNNDLERNSSLIGQLKQNRLINKKLFTQKHITSSTGKMFIGDLPNEIIEDMKNYGTCPIIKYKKSQEPITKWECNLISIFLGDKIENPMKIEKSANFDTGTNVIFSPAVFLKNLEFYYFKDLIYEKICSWQNDGHLFFYICINDKRIWNLPDINFVFGKWFLKMKSKDLFIPLSNDTLFFIINTNGLINSWTIGQPLLKKFHMVFDHDSDVVGFYGKTDVYKISGNDFPFLIIICVIILILISLFILFFLIIKCRYRNNYSDTTNKYKNILDNK